MPEEHRFASGLVAQSLQMDVGKEASFLGYTPQHPVLIVPGFMSTGLRVERSQNLPRWEGERIYIALKKLGVHREYASASEKEKDRLSDVHLEDLDVGYGSDSSSLCSAGDASLLGDLQDGGLSDVARSNTNQWVVHMSLDLQDGVSDPPGIQVRPLSGCEGVDFLIGEDSFGLIKAFSYVFDHVLSCLEDAGYARDGNVQAASYDWRLPPSQLEVRDQFFSRTMRQIESMHRSSGEKVTLVGHSMGCQCVTYLLHYAATYRGLGWAREHVHKFVALGPVWTGAPKALRSLVLGDKMGLTLLSQVQALYLCRAVGSSAWLFPRIGVYPMYVRNEGLYELQVGSADLTVIWKRTHDIVSYASVSLGQSCRTVHTKSDYGGHPNYNSLFQFVSKLSNSVERDVLTISIHKKSKVMSKRVTVQSSLDRRSFRVTELLDGVQKKQFSGQLVLKDRSRISIELRYCPARDLTREKIAPYVAEIDPGFDANFPANVVPCRPDQPLYPDVHDVPTSEGRYTEEMLYLDELDGKLQQYVTRFKMERSMGYAPPYRRDLVPQPPVDNIVAIYGVNVDTEVTTFVRRRTFRAVGRGQYNAIVTRYKTDDDVKTFGHFTVRKGVAYETKSTPQTVVDTGVLRSVSGDGTVPFSSMRYCMLWNGVNGCQVRTVEIDGAPHREMLSDERVLYHLLKEVLRPPRQVITVRIDRIEHFDLAAQAVVGDGRHKTISVAFVVKYQNRQFKTPVFKAPSETHCQRFEASSGSTSVTFGRSSARSIPLLYTLQMNGNTVASDKLQYEDFVPGMQEHRVPLSVSPQSVLVLAVHLVTNEPNSRNDRFLPAPHHASAPPLAPSPAGYPSTQPSAPPAAYPSTQPSAPPAAYPAYS